MLIHTYYIHIYLYMYSCDVKGKTYAGTEQVTPRRTAQPFYGRGRRYGVTMGMGIMGNLMITLWSTNSYWKWPSRNSGFSHKKMVIFHSFLYVYQRVLSMDFWNWHVDWTKHGEIVRFDSQLLGCEGGGYWCQKWGCFDFDPSSVSHVSLYCYHYYYYYNDYYHYTCCYYYSIIFVVEMLLLSLLSLSLLLLFLL